MMEAVTNTTIKGGCPRQDGMEKDVWHSCYISTQLPLKVDGTWVRIAPLEGRVRNRPTPTNQTQTPISSPLPALDCTDMSFTHPDWLIENFFYAPQFTSGNTTVQAVINFTATSRATTARIECHWPGEEPLIVPHTYLSRMDCYMAGFPNGTDPFQSNSTFDVSFDERSNEMEIRQSWTCGDSEGKHA
jgi:hypothetical protein